MRIAESGGDTQHRGRRERHGDRVAHRARAQSVGCFGVHSWHSARLSLGAGSSATYDNLDLAKIVDAESDHRFAFNRGGHGHVVFAGDGARKVVLWRYLWRSMAWPDGVRTSGPASGDQFYVLFIMHCIFSLLLCEVKIPELVILTGLVLIGIHPAHLTLYSGWVGPCTKTVFS